MLPATAFELKTERLLALLVESDLTLIEKMKRLEDRIKVLEDKAQEEKPFMICTTCNGTGYCLNRKDSSMYGKYYQNEPCDLCKGTGQITPKGTD